MLLRTLGNLEAHTLVLSQEYNDDRRNAADVFLKTIQELYKLLPKA